MGRRVDAVKLLPGTLIETGKLKEGESRKIFDTVFSCGGLVLSQVCNMIGVEAYTVQNWVKRRYVSNPKGRMYDVDQFSRLVIINMLKQSMQLDTIEKLLSYINGHLDDTKDDMITDSELYHLFVSILLKLEEKHDIDLAKEIVVEVTESYIEPVAGARSRLERVLLIMTQAYFSAEFRKRAEMMLCEID